MHINSRLFQPFYAPIFDLSLTIAVCLFHKKELKVCLPILSSSVITLTTETVILSPQYSGGRSPRHLTAGWFLTNPEASPKTTEKNPQPNVTKNLTPVLVGSFERFRHA